MNTTKSVIATFNTQQFALTVAKAGTGSGTVTSSPAGINCGADCTEGYTSGTSVTLTATPAASFSFTGWSGACTGMGTCTVIMDGAKSVTATFLPAFTLAVIKAGVGNGTVTSSPAGIDCGADCSESYASGTSVTLTAAPASGSTFVGWSGGGCSGAGDCTVAMNAATLITATFNLGETQTFTLAVTKAGTGSGTITSSPAGINCGADCSESYASGALVTLMVAPASGSTFVGWSGGGCSGVGDCTVAMNAASLITATFNLLGTPSHPHIDLGTASGTQGATVQIPITLTSASGTGIAAIGMDIGYDVNVLENPEATVGPAGSAAGKAVNKSTPSSGVFRIGIVGFNNTTIGDGIVAQVTFTIKSTANPGSTTLVNTPSASDPEGNVVVVSGSHGSVTVTGLGPGPDFTLTVARAGTGSGTVTSSPAGIDCGADCSESYGRGTSVTLTATPASGATFAGWSGDCSGMGTCSVTLDAAKSVTATFNTAPPVFTLTVTRVGTGSGTITSSPAGIDCGTDCSESYAGGVSVTLTAASASGSTFVGWGGGGCSGVGDCTVAMNAATLITAAFNLGEPSPHPRIDLGTGSGTQGATVQIPITLTNVSGTSISAIGMDIGYDTNVLENPVANIGTAGSAAGKSVNMSTPSPSVFRIGIIGFNDTPIGDGIVAYVTFTIKSTANPGSTTLVNTPSASDPEGNVVVVSGSHGLVTMTGSGPGPDLTLTVTKSGTGNGTITSSPAGINCGSDCSGSYADGTAVTLTTTPANGFTFAGWAGDPDCSDGQVTMDTDKTCTATFNLQPTDALPDLVVTSLIGSFSAPIGGQIDSWVEVVNQGSGDAGKFRLKYYYSTDPAITVSDVDSGWYCEISGLAAGKTQTCSGLLGVPSSLAPGTYYLGAMVDGLGAITESNENNNTRSADSGPITVTAEITSVVSGFILDSKRVPILDAMLEARDSEGTLVGTTLTHGQGDYRLNLPAGQYTLTPTKETHLFSPASRKVTVKSKDIKKQNFTCKRLQIGGGIKDQRKKPLSRVTVHLHQGDSTVDTTTTDANGKYAFWVYNTGTYTVEPVQEGNRFDPQSIEVVITRGSKSNVNFKEVP